MKDYLFELRSCMDQHCRPGEVKSLCAELELDYAALPGNTRLLKLHGLIEHLAGQGQLELLIGLLKRRHASVSWPEVPPPARQMQDQHTMTVMEDGGEATLRRFLIELRQAEPTLRSGDNGETVQVTRHLSESIAEILPRLGPRRKGELLKMLYESNLITGRSAPLSLQGADLSHVDLSWQHLPEVNLNGADMYAADLSLCNLRGAYLAGVNLRQAQLNAYLVDADLVGSDLREAQLAGVRLNRANLAGAIMRVADMSGADLEGADLTGADLTLANLSQANLTSADLSLARLDDANLAGTNLLAATLDDVNLSRTAVEHEQLKQASSLKGAILLPQQGHAYG